MKVRGTHRETALLTPQYPTDDENSRRGRWVVSILRWPSLGKCEQKENKVKMRNAENQKASEAQQKGVAAKGEIICTKIVAHLLPIVICKEHMFSQSQK
jgi:hypothetical protein